MNSAGNPAEFIVNKYESSEQGIFRLVKSERQKYASNNTAIERKNKMNEIWYRNPFAEMKAIMDSMWNNDDGFGFSSTGLKGYIKRPHDLITRKDENGNVTEFSIDVVYTPFSKNEVKVEVLDNTLTVKCGSENKIKDVDMAYCGISHQAYEFTLPLSEIVDTTKITAKAEDGILRITLPVKAIEEKKSQALQIEVK